MKLCATDLETLLHEALELPPDRRESFLDETCGSDAALRSEIESLIRADAEAGDFLARPLLVGHGASPRTAEGSGRVLDKLLGAATPAARPARQGTTWTPGSVVADRYRIVRALGRGGMGEVYRAEDLKLGETVALKVLPETMARDEVLRTRFLHEVKLARRVAHPNVCRVFDVGEAEGLSFLTMEYIDGEDFASRLRRTGRPSFGEALEVVRQLCQGLAAVHERGVLHRDLKPSNLMIDGEGRLRITDFGLAGPVGHIRGAEVRWGSPA